MQNYREKTEQRILEYMRQHARLKYHGSMIEGGKVHSYCQPDADQLAEHFLSKAKSEAALLLTLISAQTDTEGRLIP